MRPVIAALLILLLVTSATRGAVTNATVKASLAREIPQIDFNNVGLGDAIEFLRDLSGANFNVHWKTLEILHVTRETPVNIKLRYVSMRKALELILAEAGAATPLSYYIDQGVIEITTREAADSRMITRVYDVGDLILELPTFEPPDLNLRASTGSGGRSGGGSGGGGIFSNAGGNNRTDEKNSTRAERGQQLVRVIQNAIRPEIWQENGGAASIQYFRGRLIVTAPRSVQEMIGGSFD